MKQEVVFVDPSYIHDTRFYNGLTIPCIMKIQPLTTTLKRHKDEGVEDTSTIFNLIEEGKHFDYNPWYDGTLLLQTLGQDERVKDITCNKGVEDPLFQV